MGKTIYFLSIALLLVAGIFAQSAGTLSVVKSAQESASLGDTITVSITVTNNGPSPASAYVEEMLGNVQPVDPQPTYPHINASEYAGMQPFISWTLDVPAGGSKTVEYKIKPLTVGELDIGPTSVVVGGEKFYSNGLQIQIACTSAPGCDDSIGETPLTCPDKCGGDPNATVAGPDFTPQPFPSPVATMPDPEAIRASAQKSAESADPLRGLALPIAVIVIVFVAAGAYMFFFRKKK